MKLWLILQDSQSCEQHTRVRETGYRLNITSQSVVLGLKNTARHFIIACLHPYEGVVRSFQ
ncbi:hypothetical protein M1D72_20940 [Vibrio sp. AK197]|uniref:Uncharacterized protein n=1 Tax=Vibrio olivae TaxID=1243002 RepID=A0ABV5HQH3_9VIBR